MQTYVYFIWAEVMKMFLWLYEPRFLVGHLRNVEYFTGILFLSIMLDILCTMFSNGLEGNINV